jgi:hypothetical protein
MSRILNLSAGVVAMSAAPAAVAALTLAAGGPALSQSFDLRCFASRCGGDGPRLSTEAINLRLGPEVVEDAGG